MIEPTVIEILPSDLAVKWNDDHETFIDLVTLRNTCPCAACKGEQHLWGKTAPTIDSSKLEAASFEVISYKMIGRYGVRFIWADRHDSGIYPYELLLMLCQCEECSSRRAH